MGGLVGGIVTRAGPVAEADISTVDQKCLRASISDRSLSG
jgi:hypothetical protein